MSYMVNKVVPLIGLNKEIIMGRKKSVIDAALVASAEQALADIKDGYVAIRLLAIINYSEDTAKNISNFLKVDIRTLFRWVKKFKEDGIEGLRDSPKGHKPSILTAEMKAQLKDWVISMKDIEGNDLVWTLGKLQKELRRKYSVEISVPALSNNLKKLRIVLRRPRPTHQNADAEKQDTFKKNSTRSD